MLCKSVSRLVLAIACLVPAIGLFAQPAAALSCMPPDPVEHLEHAHIVFTGTVGNTSGEWAVVDVDRYYKGNGPAKVTVRTDVTWGPFLTSGEQWLLYVNVGDRGVWGVNLCSSSRLISGGQPLSQDELDLLGPGVEPEPSPERASSGSSRLLIWGAGAVAAVALAFAVGRLTTVGRGRVK